MLCHYCCHCLCADPLLAPPFYSPLPVETDSYSIWSPQNSIGKYLGPYVRCGAPRQRDSGAFGQGRLGARRPLESFAIQLAPEVLKVSSNLALSSNAFCTRADLRPLAIQVLIFLASKATVSQDGFGSG